MSKSKYFLLFCVAFICGIFFGSYYSTSIWILLLIVGFCISLIFLFWKKEKVIILFLIIILFIFGLLRIESEKLNEIENLEIENLNNQEMLVRGVISEMPEIKNGKQKLILKNIEIIGSKKDINGKVILYVDKYPEYNLLDEIEINGKLQIPEDFDGFEYKNYLFSRGIYFVIYYPKIKVINTNEKDLYFQISKFRKFSNNIIKKIFPQPQAGIVSAMTLGLKSDISSETLESFNRTGTRHIIAISGLHMTIVAVIFMYLLLAIGLRRSHAFYFAILGIVFFVALVGFPASAVRASVMGGLVLLAVKVGRLSNAGNAIIFAGVLMLLYDPNLLRFDTGFQLSFLAVLGIVYIFPKLDIIFEKYSNFLNIKAIFLITISAQIATLPIILNSFGSFSILSVFANIVVLPFVPTVMLGGFLVMVIGSANLFIAQILSFPIWLVLTFQIEVVKFFASFDFGYLSFERVSIWTMIIYYGVLVFILLFYNKKIPTYFEKLR
ncbi:MAG: ComEC/Rec2 family competence protein [Patescibacteria group bacterium]|nr:ComEC/Rec2 family competence protein [Patescibacteria group bacterium]